jgi:hypothetical protein
MTVHQLALRMVKHLGVTSLDPADPSNVNGGEKALAEGDVDDIMAAINAALQEVWTLAPISTRVHYFGATPQSTPPIPAVTRSDVGAASDPAIRLPVPNEWAESVLLPLAMQRFSSHPRFTPSTAKAELDRQADLARKIINRPSVTLTASSLIPCFR